MTIKPTDRPQSLREWLDLFGKKDADEAVGEDDVATRFFANEVETEEITPVAPPAPGYEPKELETQVPSDPREVQFKRAGEETGAPVGDPLTAAPRLEPSGRLPPRGSRRAGIAGSAN